MKTMLLAEPQPLVLASVRPMPTEVTGNRQHPVHLSFQRRSPGPGAERSSVCAERQ